MGRSQLQQQLKISKETHYSSTSWTWNQSLQSHSQELRSHTTKCQHKLQNHKLHQPKCKHSHWHSHSHRLRNSLWLKLNLHKSLRLLLHGLISNLLALWTLKLHQPLKKPQLTIGCNFCHQSISNMFSKDLLKVPVLPLNSVVRKQFVSCRLKSREKLPLKLCSSSLGSLPLVSACFTSTTRWLRLTWSPSVRSKACK